MKTKLPTESEVKLAIVKNQLDNLVRYAIELGLTKSQFVKIAKDNFKKTEGEKS